MFSPIYVKKYIRRIVYLESTSNGQYIDTSIAFDKTQNTKLVVEAASLGNWRSIVFGNYAPGNPCINIEYGVASTTTSVSRCYVSMGGPAVDVRSPQVAFNTKQKIEIEYIAETKTVIFKVNDQQIAEQTVQDTIYTYQRNFKLFIDNRSTNPIKGATRIYSAKLWKNDVLVRNMLPVIGKLNKPGMFDYISKNTFYNLGSSEFLYGELS